MKTIPGFATIQQAEASIKTGDGVEKREDGCWIWHEPNPVTGMGPFLPFYEAAFGMVPHGFEIRHLCANARNGCVRPTHLDIVQPGTKAANMWDPAIALEARSTFAARLAAERAARKASQWQFARELGISKSTYISWEQGKTLPPNDTIRSLHKELGWAGQKKNWTVTLVVQRVVLAHSAGEAALQVTDLLQEEGKKLKYAVHDVRETKPKR